MDNHELFEREFVALVDSLAAEKGFSNSEFGKQVFGEASGVRIWRFCKDPKRLRDISLKEAHKMAEVLEIDLPTLLWRLTQYLDSKK